jgi:hypothetical protein
MLTKYKLQTTLCVGVVLLLGSAASARASWTATFDKGSIITGVTPNDGSDSSSVIAQYLASVVGCSGCVTVSAGAAVAQQYNADGHVVGTAGSLTLGNSNGAMNNTVAPGSYTGAFLNDYYISNLSAGATGGVPHYQLSQGIVITFTKGYSLTGTFSFDYQIMPDGTCTQLNTTNCGAALSGGHYANQPDLIFIATGGSTNINTTFWGVTPGTTNGATTTSPLSANELSPQAIGTSGNFLLTGATQLQFNDWPAAIGVDNMKLVTPEPAGQVFLLAGLALVALAGNRLRRTMTKSSPEA